MKKSRVWREAEAGFQFSYKLNSEKLGWITVSRGDWHRLLTGMGFLMGVIRTFWHSMVVMVAQHCEHAKQKCLHYSLSKRSQGDSDACEFYLKKTHKTFLTS